jgi:hypothetical protein
MRRCLIRVRRIPFIRMIPLDSPFRRPRCRRSFDSALLLASALFLGGCATTEVTVDSLAKPDAENSVSYQLKNINPLVADDSLRFKEASDYVRTALSGKGMYEAPPNVKPDLVVAVDYGIGPPQTKMEVVSEPVYVEIPGRIRTETRQIGTDPVTQRPILVQVTVQDPSTSEFAGFREYEISTTVYEKYLRLTARENAEAVEGRPASEVWTVDVTSEGQSRDLRKNLPVLVAASIEYIGKDSQGQKTIKIKDKDSDVAFVKKGM